MNRPKAVSKKVLKMRLPGGTAGRLSSFYRKLRAANRTLYNRVRYGPSAPRYGEYIWVNPQDCKRHLSSVYLRKKFNLTLDEARARVIEEDWPLEQALPIRELPLVKNCIEHWVSGTPWEKTGEFERMQELITTSKRGVSHGCRDFGDIVARYENLDRVFEQVRREGRFRVSNEVGSSHRWGADEMLVHVGPGGELFKGGEGMHRFAMALILDIPFPAHFSCVHVSAIPDLDRLRKARGAR